MVFHSIHDISSMFSSFNDEFDVSWTNTFALRVQRRGKQLVKIIKSIELGIIKQCLLIIA